MPRKYQKNKVEKLIWKMWISIWYLVKKIKFPVAKIFKYFEIPQISTQITGSNCGYVDKSEDNCSIGK